MEHHVSHGQGKQFSCSHMPPYPAVAALCPTLDAYQGSRPRYGLDIESTQLRLQCLQNRYHELYKRTI